VPLGRSGKLRRTWQVQGGGRGSSWLARGGRTDGGERARPSARAVSLQQGAPLFAPHGRAAVAAAARRPARRPAGRGRRAPPGDGWPSYPSLRADALYHEGLALAVKPSDSGNLTVGMKMRSFVLKGPSVRKKMRAPIFEICPLILFQVFCFRSKPCDSVLVQVASTGTDVSSVTGARNTGRGRIASSTAPLSARAVSLQQGAPLFAPHGRAAVAAAARRPARRPAGRGRRAPPGDGWPSYPSLRADALYHEGLALAVKIPLILFQVFCFRSKPCDSVLVQVASTGTDVSIVTGARNRKGSTACAPAFAKPEVLNQNVFALTTLWGGTSQTVPPNVVCHATRPRWSVCPRRARARPAGAL
jgi:hypothetical protein